MTRVVPEPFSTASGILLHRFRPVTTARGPVVLAHGMFGDQRAFRRIAASLAGSGHDVWTFDFRGHGESVAADDGEDFESVCLADVRSVLDEVRRRSRAPRLSWIGHSGGGLAILMFLARHPEEQAGIGRVATLASQANGACENPLGRLKVAAVLAAVTALGGAPGHRFGLGTGPETRAVMRQWCLWNLAGRWRGRDGFDYIAAMGRVETPCLSLAGAGDTFIAPPSGCRRIHDALGSEERAFLVCGPDEGFRERYGHARIAFSRAASAEVWPRVEAWLGGQSRARAARATA